MTSKPSIDTPDAAVQTRMSLVKGRDIVAGGIMVSAIIMFVGTGGAILPDVVNNLLGENVRPDNVASTALLLNIALIIFGWRRYRELSEELEQHKAAEEQARALAITDPLTGCLNRRAIGEKTSDMLARAERRGLTVAYVMIDLDNFKSINDVQGHDAGDRVLVEVARRIAHILPPGALLARLGGDEFACSIPFNPDVPEAVQRVVEDLIDTISQPIADPSNVDFPESSVSASIGIARADDAENSLDSLMRRSDIAMYFSKRQGRNRFSWFNPRMENEVQLRNKIETGMRLGIRRGEFIPYYEQQIDLSNGQLIGFEVLARWDSPELGLVSPEVFIPIAEDTGMINELSVCVMRQAMVDARGWNPLLTISVNISPVQLRDPWFAQKIVKLLVETGFPANRLEIEITESCLFENINLAQSIIGSLKNQGVRIALDDFGTGYSSLAHLRALPFDRIKIDRSFITSMAQSNESQAIVKTIASLGESMGLPITAEGIETAASYDTLVALGCNKGQGYHFGQPMPIEKTRKLLAERNLLTHDGSGTADQPDSQPEVQPARRAVQGGE